EATFEYDDYNLVWQHRTWGTSPDPDYPWALFIYGEKGTLKASTMRADFVPLDKNAKPVHFDCYFEREKYPEDVTEADIEQGHISTATCILANLSMELGRPLRYDPKRRIVIGDPEATKRLQRPYRAPWHHPLPA
ncbi:MAG TPA: gfo/Idh/MocA family oxidoreductase, partial [Verrucomicrobiae bacterium]|nr:gfo/Idh/MocA family oxidoreductase [Verrucomicrobiae bacterium]